MIRYLQRYGLPLLVPATKTYHSSRTWQSIFTVFRRSKRLDFGVLVHIIISENDLLLTEIWSSPPGRGKVKYLTRDGHDGVVVVNVLLLVGGWWV